MRLLFLETIENKFDPRRDAKFIKDGMDALATGTIAIIAAAYLALPRGTLSPIGCVVAASTVAACLGFLPANWPQASIFLGDSGSTLLGFTIAFLAVDFRHGSSSTPSPLAFVFLVAAVPLLDAALAAIRRLRNRVSALRGDRRHGYDLMLSRGASVRVTLALFYGITLALSVLGLFMVYGSSKEAAALAAASLAILVAAAIKLGSLKKEGVPGIANLPIGVLESGPRQKQSAAT